MATWRTGITVGTPLQMSATRCTRRTSAPRSEEMMSDVVQVPDSSVSGLGMGWEAAPASQRPRRASPAGRASRSPREKEGGSGAKRAGMA